MQFTAGVKYLELYNIADDKKLYIAQVGDRGKGSKERSPVIHSKGEIQADSEATTQSTFNMILIGK